ncbi:MAG: TetR/AcrR family transcriptional regulator C-terminal domain-containing protein [Janthinobacterium lividum]
MADEPGLTSAHIAQTALDLIDANGLAAFSLRHLARALNVSAPAIYWHLPNRNAVLAEVIALVLADVLPPRAARWQDFLRALIASFRAAMHCHPNAAPLLGAELVANSATDLSLVENILEALSQAGFSGARLVAAYNTVCVAMVGFAMEELCPMPEESAVWQATVQERLQGISSQNFPLLRAHIRLIADKAFMLRWRNGVAAPMDRSFSFFVDTVLAGLEAQAAQDRPDDRLCAQIGGDPA